MALDNIDRDDIRCWCETCQDRYPIDEYNQEHLHHDQPSDREDA